MAGSDAILGQWLDSVITANTVNHNLPVIQAHE